MCLFDNLSISPLSFNSSSFTISSISSTSSLHIYIEFLLPKTDTSKEFVSLTSSSHLITTGHNKNFHSFNGFKTKLIEFTNLEIVSAFQFITEILVEDAWDCELEINSKFSNHFISSTSKSFQSSICTSICRVK
ncbi:MAG: hypothetical protein LBD88_00095 [Candidatus Peribacteria bacterium]|nr:hypothetical protein [Candidatus Peribacteria bacterium]